MAGEAAAAEPEIAITIIPDETANVEAATGEVAKKADVAKVEVKDPALEDLMAQYKDLEKRAQDQEQRRRDAERQAAEHKAEADASKKRETSSRLDTITTALSAAQEDAERAKSDIKAAHVAGDPDAMVEAQDRLAKARSQEMRLDEAKQDIEARAKAPPQPRPAPSNDPVEAFIQNRTQQTADWIRAHPEYVRSERGLRKLTAADAVAQAEDLIPDTPEYFARVEEYLGIGKKAEVEKAPTEAAQVQPKRSAAPPVAPGSAVSSNGSSGSPSVALTQREVNAATDGTIVWNWNDPNGKFKKGDPVGLQEMARRKLELQRRGAYDRSFTEG